MTFAARFRLLLLQGCDICDDKRLLEIVLPGPVLFDVLVLLHWSNPSATERQKARPLIWSAMPLTLVFFLPLFFLRQQLALCFADKERASVPFLQLCLVSMVKELRALQPSQKHHKTNIDRIARVIVLGLGVWAEASKLFKDSFQSLGGAARMH